MPERDPVTGKWLSAEPVEVTPAEFADEVAAEIEAIVARSPEPHPELAEYREREIERTRALVALDLQLIEVAGQFKSLLDARASLDRAGYADRSQSHVPWNHPNTNRLELNRARAVAGALRLVGFERTLAKDGVRDFEDLTATAVFQLEKLLTAAANPPKEFYPEPPEPVERVQVEKRTVVPGGIHSIDQSKGLMGGQRITFPDWMSEAERRELMAQNPPHRLAAAIEEAAAIHEAEQAQELQVQEV